LGGDAREIGGAPAEEEDAKGEEGEVGLIYKLKPGYFCHFTI